MQQMHNFYTRSGFPFTIFTPCLSTVMPFVKEANWKEIDVIFQKDSFAIYGHRNIILKAGEETLERMKRESIERFISKWREVCTKAGRFFGEQYGKGLGSLSDAQLVEFQKKVYGENLKLWRTGIFVEALDDFLPVKLGEILGKKGISKKESNTIAPILSSETEITPVYKRNNNLLEIAEQFRKENLSTKSGKGEEIISEFIEKNYFMSCSYSTFEKPTEEEIREIVEEKLKDKVQPRERILETKEKLWKKKAEKEKLMQRLGFSEDERFVVKTIEVLNEVHEERKEVFQKLTFIHGEILKEISRRKGVSFEEAALLTEEEVGDFFAGKISKEELSKRRKLSLMVMEEGKPTKFFVGKEAEERVKDIQGEISETAEVEGMCASPGTASGPACIQLKPDPASFKEGSILVATMTTPEFVPLMNKAAAIVTDEGGIT